MKILFLHSGWELTGALTYARALEAAWRSHHEVYWASDRPFFQNCRYFALPLSRKLIPHGLRNAVAVARIIRRHGIDILHSHSRRANCVAALASCLTGVPYVTTAHLRMKRHAWNRMLGCWGARTLAICESIASHLKTVNGVPEGRVAFVRNGIDTQYFRPMPEIPIGAEPSFLVVGRISGHRWRAAAFVLSMLPEILRRFPSTRVRFAGAVEPKHAEEFRDGIRRINEVYPSARVEHLGFVDDIRPWIARSTLVLAAGRSLLEALAMEKPGLAVGEEGGFGLLTPQNYEQARSTNFGDFTYSQRGVYNGRLLVEGVARVFSDASSAQAALGSWGRSMVLRDYNASRVAEDVENVYRQVLVSSIYRGGRPRPWIAPRMGV